MNIDFRTIEIVMALKKYNSISKASQNLYISEPALSKQLKKIELMLGYPLVKRSSLGVELTEAGKILVEKGARLLEERENILDEMNEIMRPGISRKSLRVGLASCYAETLIPKIVSEYLKEYPQFKTEMIIGKTNELEVMCVNKEIDLCLSQIEALNTQLKAAEIAKEETVVYLPSSYIDDPKLSEHIRKGSIKLSLLGNYPHGEVKGRAKFNEFSKGICADIPSSSPSLVQSDNWSVVLNLIKQGLCFAVMPDIFEVDQKEIIKLHIETDCPVSRTLVLAYPKDSHISEKSKAFISVAKKVLMNN